MKKQLLLLFLFLSISLSAQKSFRYGITAGLNISSGILPELKLNTNINSILKGDDVVQGNPQLADYVAMYKAGMFMRYDGKIGSIKLNVNYTTTNIKKTLDLTIFNAEVLDIDLAYLDFDLTYQLNITKVVYINLGYIPSILLSDNIDLAEVQKIDSRILSGIGFKIFGGATVDLNAVIGLKEVIDGSYIHNLMIPVTLNVPLN